MINASEICIVLRLIFLLDSLGATKLGGAKARDKVKKIVGFKMENSLKFYIAASYVIEQSA